MLTTHANPVQTHRTLLGYASTITRQKKSWVLLDPKFEALVSNFTQQLPTTPVRMFKRTQQVSTMFDVGGQQCCKRLGRALRILW